MVHYLIKYINISIQPILYYLIVNIIIAFQNNE